MKWSAAAFALNHLVFPALVALLLLYFFRDAPATANPFVDQVNHWLGFDALTRAFEHRY